MRRGHRTAHRWIWRVLIVLLPAMLLGAMAIRPSGPLEAPAIRLTPPQLVMPQLVMPQLVMP